MSDDNGRLLPSELTTVEGLPLGVKTANAYARLKAAAKAAGIDIWIAQPIGGYRSFAVQADMKVNPGKYGLSTVSTVNIASAGYSTHGLGNALDIGSFGSAYGTAGAKRSAWLIQHAPEFGFFREFGDRDPNHFHHDGFTAVEPLTGGLSAAGATITPLEEDDLYTDADRARDNQIKNILDAVTRSGYGHVLDEGDLGTILTAVKANRGAPHPTRSDYGRLLDLGDLAQLLNVIPAGTSTDPVAVANALLPALLQGLGDRLVTDGDLAASLAPIAEALGKLPDEVRATLKAAL